MTTELAQIAHPGLSSDFPVPRGSSSRIEWINEELKRVDYEMKALAYTTVFSIIGIAVASALLYIV